MWSNGSPRSAEQFEVPMRVITFAVRGRTMYPPEVGLHAEDSILAAWETTPARHSRSCGPTVSWAKTPLLQVVSGNGWDQALDAADWEDGELLALGTSPARRISPGCSWDRAARRSCGTAPFRCWCYRAEPVLRPSV